MEYLVDGQKLTANANREVVLAAGAIGSPQLLMVSGIGPAEHLRSQGIDVAHDLPGVGKNLQDHPFSHVTFAADGPIDGGEAPDMPRVLLRSDPTEDPNLQFVFLHFPLPHRKSGAAIEPWGSADWRPERVDGYSVLSWRQFGFAFTAVSDADGTEIAAFQKAYTEKALTMP